MTHHMSLESTICELTVATTIPMTYFQAMGSRSSVSFRFSRYLSNCRVAKAGATSKKLEKRIPAHCKIRSLRNFQKICTQSGRLSALITMPLKAAVALSDLTTLSMEGSSVFSSFSWPAAARPLAPQWKLYRDQRLTFFCASTSFPSLKTAGRLCRQNIVDINAIDARICAPLRSELTRYLPR